MDYMYIPANTISLFSLSLKALTFSDIFPDVLTSLHWLIYGFSSYIFRLI